jgi:hypothetical protein
MLVGSALSPDFIQHKVRNRVVTRERLGKANVAYELIARS